ncbi:type II secretion system protein [Malaciobacter mytili]|uniref:type II secretion system protein n=1 Tax=Malaciobacter mytili TaxID=603050 RepID=UPI003A8424E0
MKQAFSLLELVFVLVILAIIGSFAVPKYMNTRDVAVVITVKRDITTIVNALQTQYLASGRIDDISKFITINNKNWNVNKNKMWYSVGEKECVSITLNESQATIEVKINKDIDKICKKLREAGVKDSLFDLY